MHLCEIFGTTCTVHQKNGTVTIVVSDTGKIIGTDVKSAALIKLLAIVLNFFVKYDF